ncbi:class I SAM-dependent methyltransferase [Microlunatus soli]|uniref:Methyltransferase domain-containing protein n=1 Tax=Microlunatus soli TaxID=630515 RepID=A0A1H1QXA2_9ACTN|nr:class I SAM-dependent methyltransferase [Microlunatus soli]SDS27996.1 Methyltransferase domain-containing protein [Microlunatus soli]
MSGRRSDENEHFAAYAEIRSRRLDQWSDPHEQRTGYDDVPSRQFVDRVVRPADNAARSALVYGCGSGGSAVRLAELGYRVTAVDLVPDAVTLAREHARRRGGDIEFAIQDVWRWGPTTARFDLILDQRDATGIVWTPTATASPDSVVRSGRR